MAENTSIMTTENVEAVTEVAENVIEKVTEKGFQMNNLEFAGLLTLAAAVGAGAVLVIQKIKSNKSKTKKDNKLSKFFKKTKDVAEDAVEELGEAIEDLTE